MLPLDHHATTHEQPPPVLGCSSSFASRVAARALGLALLVAGSWWGRLQQGRRAAASCVVRVSKQPLTYARRTTRTTAGGAAA